MNIFKPFLAGSLALGTFANSDVAQAYYDPYYPPAPPAHNLRPITNTELNMLIAQKAAYDRLELRLRHMRRHRHVHHYHWGTPVTHTYHTVQYSPYYTSSYVTYRPARTYVTRTYRWW